MAVFDIAKVSSGRLRALVFQPVAELSGIPRAAGDGRATNQRRQAPTVAWRRQRPVPVAAQTNTAVPASSHAPPATKLPEVQMQRRTPAEAVRAPSHAETRTLASNPGRPVGSTSEKAQEIVAQYDRLIAEARHNINGMTLQIDELQKQIVGLKTDSKKTEELLAEVSKQGSAPGKVQALVEHLKANNEVIHDKLNQIQSRKQKRKEFEHLIATLQEKKAIVLAKRQAAK
ncbi:MAG: hypothetical protein IT521_13055 [Burkholderiales bacterium]|nr:hypothetical protein [Burkholderiales bacterium]